MIKVLTAGRVFTHKKVARLRETSRERGIQWHFHDISWLFFHKQQLDIENVNAPIVRNYNVWNV